MEQRSLFIMKADNSAQRLRPFTLIQHRYNTLSANQKVVADYLLRNKEKAALLTLRDLAGACNTSETTVMRCIRKLGYDSFQIFRVDLARDYSELRTKVEGKSSWRIEDGYQTITASDDMETLKRKVIQSVSDSLLGIDTLVNTQALEEAVELILGSDRLFFYGSGGSNVIAYDAYHKFMRMGLTTIYDANSHFFIIKSGLMTEKDTVMLVSHTGESKEVVEAARNAKAAGAHIIGLTSYISSSLAQLADVVLYSSTNSMEYYTDAMVSRLIQLVILDMLFIATRIRMGDKADQSIESARKTIRPSKTK